MANDFGSDPTPSIKRKFGMLALIVNAVIFESGASYSVPGVLGRAGELREFKGKRLATAKDDKSADHVIFAMRAHNKDGEEYLMWRDMTTLGSDKKWVVLQKSLKANFGKDYAALVKPSNSLKSANWFPGAIDEVPTGEAFVGADGNNVAISVWKISELFNNEKEMREAEAKHFSRASSNGAPAIDADMIESVRALVKASKGNDAKLRQFIANDETLAKYDADELIKAAA